MIVDHQIIRWNDNWSFIMMKTEKSRHVVVNWKGPFGISDVLSRRVDGTAKGVYQIYSDHPTFGAEALLYIGKTFGKGGNRSFHSRLTEHDGEWACFESNCCAYLRDVSDNSGVIVDNATVELAETLLIYWHTPPYCTRSKQFEPKKLKDLWVQSIGSRYRLFNCLSTAWLIYDHRQNKLDYQASTRLEDREDDAREYVKKKSLLDLLRTTRK